MFGVDVVDLSLQLQDLFSLDGDVCGLTLETQLYVITESCLIKAHDYQVWGEHLPLHLLKAGGP